MDQAEQRMVDHARSLVDLAVKLTRERNSEARLALLLDEAMFLTAADAGTIYTREDDNTLRFAIMRNETLGIRLPDETGDLPDMPPLRLYDDRGYENHSSVATYAALTDRTVNIEDAYISQGFDFGGTRRYDQQSGYRSRSFLTVPLSNHEGDVIGVLQLINAMSPDGDTTSFSQEEEVLTESVATLAALVLSNVQLIEAQKELFESFIRIIASAIDEKNPHTSKHCQRLPVIAMLIAEAINRTGKGAYAVFSFNEAELYELGIAAWMHDCGKITTPEHVINKGTKLECLMDRLELVEARLDILEREAEIDYLRQLVDAGGGKTRAKLKQAYRQTLAELRADRQFLRTANLGGESMRPEDKERVRRLATRTWTDADGVEHGLLNEEEIRNLLIERGTLLPEERKVINRHIDVTINMLEALPYPKHLQQVPEIAGGHHEHMDGTGYPRGLKREQLSVRARIMGIADIFEALTAADRPYKRGKKLSESLEIMGRMCANQHIDSDLFDLFVREGVYLEYASQHMANDQIDEVDISRIKGLR